MGSLSAVTKNEITKILDSTHFTQHGFTVKYDDEDNLPLNITFSSRPEYRFVINSNHDANGFTTTECPGTRSESAETFQRTDIGLCLQAVREWTERVAEREKERDWILDEFGGVADMNPSLRKGY